MVQEILRDPHAVARMVPLLGLGLRVKGLRVKGLGLRV
jgi:hypothetical protein